MGGNEFALAMQCGYKQGYEDGAIAELEKIKEVFKSKRDEWIKGQDAEWHTYDRCLVIIDNELSENREARIDELERLKEKLDDEYSELICLYEEDYMYSDGLRKAIELIDSRIEELKED